MICTARSSESCLCIVRRITPCYKFNQQTDNLLSVSSAPIRRVHKQLYQSQIWWHVCKIYVRFFEKMVCSLLLSFHCFCLLPPPCSRLCLCHLLHLCCTISYFISPKLLPYLYIACLSFLNQVPCEHRNLGCHLLLQTVFVFPYSCLLVFWVVFFLMEKCVEELENGQWAVGVVIYQGLSFRAGCVITSLTIDQFMWKICNMHLVFAYKAKH